MMEWLYCDGNGCICDGGSCIMMVLVGLAVFVMVMMAVL